MKFLKMFNELFTEKIILDIEEGDDLYGGRFKNKKTTVKKIGKDEYGDPTINNKPLLKYRTKKSRRKNQK